MKNTLDKLVKKYRVKEIMPTAKELLPNIKERKILPCGESRDYWGEVDCEYLSMENPIMCDDCVCTGGYHDPRYDYDKQPSKRPKFIEYTMLYNQARQDWESSNEDNNDK